MVLCVGLNITDTSCLPGPSSTLNVPFGNGRSTAILLTFMFGRAMREGAQFPRPLHFNHHLVPRRKHPERLTRTWQAEHHSGLATRGTTMKGPVQGGGLQVLSGFVSTLL